MTGAPVPGRNDASLEDLRMSDAFSNSTRAQIDDAAQSLLDRLGRRPRAAFVLGTGHRELAEHLAQRVALAAPTLPDGVAFAHGAPLCGGTLDGVPVVVTGASLPYHEGHAAARIATPLRVLRRLGAEVLVLTAGVASLGADPEPGTIAIVEDHLDLSATHLLRTTQDTDVGPRFPDQSEPYAARLRDLAQRAAHGLGMTCPDAILAAVPGPVLPTRAECRALRHLGAHLAGMSLVPEAIVARHAGFEVLALAAVLQRLDDDGEATAVPALVATADAIVPRLTALLLACAPGLCGPDHA